MVDRDRRNDVCAPSYNGEDTMEKTYYSNDDFTKILNSFVIKSDVDVKRFRKKIEICAYLYDINVERLPQEPDPSDIKRHIIALRKKTYNFLSSADWIAEG